MSSLSPIAHNFASTATQATKEAGQKIGQEVSKLGQEAADEFIQKTGNNAAKGEKKGFLNSISAFFSSVGKHITEFFNKLASFFSSKKSTVAETTQTASTTETNAAAETASQTTSQEGATTTTQINKGEEAKSTTQTQPKESTEPTHAAEEVSTPKEGAVTQEKEITPAPIEEESTKTPASEQNPSSAQHGVEQKMDQEEEITQEATNTASATPKDESKKAGSSKKGISVKKATKLAVLAGIAGKTFQSPGVRDIVGQGFEGTQNFTHALQTEYITPNYNKAQNFVTSKFGNPWSPEHPSLNFTNEGIPILHDNNTQYINVTMSQPESFGTSYYTRQFPQGFEQKAPQEGNSYWSQAREFYNRLTGSTAKQQTSQPNFVANVTAQNETATHTLSSNSPTTKALSVPNPEGKQVAISNPTCPADYKAKTNVTTTTTTPSPTHTQSSHSATSNPISMAGNTTSPAKKPEISQPACKTSTPQPDKDGDIFYDCD